MNEMEIAAIENIQFLHMYQKIIIKKTYKPYVQNIQKKVIIAYNVYTHIRIHAHNTCTLEKITSCM